MTPILPVVAAGPPVEDDHTAWGIPHAAQNLHDLRQRRLPITGCWLPFESANHWLVIGVQEGWRTLDRYHQHYSARQLCAQIGRILFDTKSGMDIPKIIVVEDDIDITDTAQVVWAFATRCNPGHGEILLGEEEMMVLPVFLDGDDKKRNYTTRVVYNCLSHDDWLPATAPRPVALRGGWPDEIQECVLANWAAYGYAPG